MKKYVLYDEWVKLPKHQKQNKFGFYVRPDNVSFEMNMVMSALGGENPVDKHLKELFPVQAFFRITLVDYIMQPFTYIKYKLMMFREKHTNYSKHFIDLIPKTYHTHGDMMTCFNLKLIKHYATDGNRIDCINWDCKPDMKEFKEWLDKTILKIDKTLPYIEERIDKAYDEIDYQQEAEFEVRYKYVRYWSVVKENLITDILTEALRRREYFSY